MNHFLTITALSIGYTVMLILLLWGLWTVADRLIYWTLSHGPPWCSIDLLRLTRCLPSEDLKRWRFAGIYGRHVALGVIVSVRARRLAAPVEETHG